MSDISYRKCSQCACMNVTAKGETNIMILNVNITTNSNSDCQAEACSHDCTYTLLSTRTNMAATVD